MTKDERIQIMFFIRKIYYIFFNISESALFTKCAQTHKVVVVVFKKLLVHKHLSDMKTETFKEA